MGSGSVYNWPGVDTATLYKSKRGWRQKAPYVPATYRFNQVKRMTTTPGFDPWPSTYSIDMLYGFRSLGLAETAATNAAYANFINAISSRASMGANLAEGRQSLNMIASRASQLRTFSRQVRSFQFAKAARTLEMAFIPKGVSKKKSFANNWLEYWFGWAPLIGDIYSAVDQLQQPIKTHIARGSSRAKWAESYIASRYSKSYQHALDIGVVSQAEIAVTNPNLWLANTLGLTNPAVVLWELVPFSFVVDWFFNVGQVLSSYSDLMGLTLKNGFTTVFITGTTKEMWTAYKWSATFSHVYVGRSTGITLPSLIRKPLRAPSGTRAATAISLLTQQLR